MRIGIDFDNTIAGYSRVFPSAARKMGLVPQEFSGDKASVKNEIRKAVDGEKNWMRLQGQVYGAHMPEAELIEGVDDFLNKCRKNGVEVFVISHKTEYGHFDEAHINLRTAAMEWMAGKNFFTEAGYGLSPDQVFFESTREEKVARIGFVGCTHFVDDLIEVLQAPGFPESVERYLLSAAGEKASPAIRIFPEWRRIMDDIFASRAA